MVKAKLDEIKGNTDDREDVDALEDMEQGEEEDGIEEDEEAWVMLNQHSVFVHIGSWYQTQK